MSDALSSRELTAGQRRVLSDTVDRTEGKVVLALQGLTEERAERQVELLIVAC